jgi:hypothetical protein
VREAVINHIRGVLNDPSHILHVSYRNLLDNILFVSEESLLAAIANIGKFAGWGGLDFCVFVANALLVDVTVFDMKNGVIHTQHIDSQLATVKRLQNVDARIPINLWFYGVHYQALIYK